MTPVTKRWDTIEAHLLPTLKALLTHKGSTYGSEEDEHANYRVLATWGLSDSAAHSVFARMIEKSFRLNQARKAGKWVTEVGWARKQTEDVLGCALILWLELYTKDVKV